MQNARWSEKLTAALREWGFVQVDNKAEDRSTWHYEGPKTHKPVTVVVPNMLEARSYGPIVARTKKKLLKSILNNDDLADFDRITLGLIEAENGDSLDVLEQKLAAAITNPATLNAAKIAFQLAQTANDTNYDSRAILQRQAEITEQRAIIDTKSKIDNILLTQLRSMFEQEFELQFPITLGYGPISINQELSEQFGFAITGDSIRDDGEFLIHGKMIKDTALPFDQHGVSTDFTALIITKPGYDIHDLCDTDDIYDFEATALHGMNKSQLQSLLESLEMYHTMFVLKGLS